MKCKATGKELPDSRLVECPRTTPPNWFVYKETCARCPDCWQKKPNVKKNGDDCLTVV